MKVFFVYKHFMGDYTIWATTKVTNIDTFPMQTGIAGEDGFAFIYFEPFDPLPRDKWVPELSDKELVGEIWRQGRFRYINKEREYYLEQLINRTESGESAKIQPPVEPSRASAITIGLMPNIIKRLEQVAQYEGRTIEEILREATAEWLKSRES